MKKVKLILTCLCSLMILTGCGEKTPEVTTLEVTKEGLLKHTIIEPFEEETVDGLTAMLNEKVTSYNMELSDGNAQVELLQVTKQENGTVLVEMTYPSSEDFDYLMNMDVADGNKQLTAHFFYGTVQEAYEKGFNLNGTLTSDDGNGGVTGKDELLSMGSNKIIIYDSKLNGDETARIIFPDKLLYVSDNVTLIGKKEVEVAGSDELAYLILE